MNTEQVIEDLDNCIIGECDICSYCEQTACKEYLMHDALALIKELQAHNENLKKENQYLRERLAEEMEHKEDMEGE